MASDGGKKLLAVTDAEAAALAAAAKAGSPPTAPPRQAVHVPYTYQVCQGDGSPDPSGLAACDIVHPQADGTWTASGSGKIRSASTDRLLCRFAGDDGSGSGVWEPVGGEAAADSTHMFTVVTNVTCDGSGLHVTTKTVTVVGHVTSISVA